MSPATASRPRDAAKPIDDFEWPPTADDLSIYELGPDPWQKLQDASSQAFVARRRELSQQRPKRAPERTPARTPRSSRTLAVVLAAFAIAAAAAGWLIHAAMTRPMPVTAIHHPAPAAEVTPAPPPITIVATYPIEPDPPSTAPAVNEPAVSGTAASATDRISPEPDLAGQVTPVDAAAEAETTAVPAPTATPASAPAAVDPGAITPDAGGIARNVPSAGPTPR